MGNRTNKAKEDILFHVLNDRLQFSLGWLDGIRACLQTIQKPEGSFVSLQSDDQIRQIFNDLQLEQQLKPEDSRSSSDRNLYIEGKIAALTYATDLIAAGEQQPAFLPGLKQAQRFPLQILLHQSLISEGKVSAARVAIEEQADLELLRNYLQWSESKIDDGTPQMALDSTPRITREGYIDAMKDIISMLESLKIEAPRTDEN